MRWWVVTNAGAYFLPTRPRNCSRWRVEPRATTRESLGLMSFTNASSRHRGPKSSRPSSVCSNRARPFSCLVVRLCLRPKFPTQLYSNRLSQLICQIRFLLRLLLNEIHCRWESRIVGLDYSNSLMSNWNRVILNRLKDGGTLSSTWIWQSQ